MARKERLRDRDSLWLFPPPFHFLLAEEREEKREKEGCGERRRPQVTFRIISAMPAPGWLRGREGGGCAGVKGKGVCAEVRGWGDRCVHFLCSLLGGSRRWIFTHSLTSSHSTLSLKSVRKLHPRAGMRAAWAECWRVKGRKRNQELVKKPRVDLRGGWNVPSLSRLSVNATSSQTVNTAKVNTSTGSHYFQIQVSQNNSERSFGWSYLLAGVHHQCCRDRSIKLMQLLITP